MGIEILHISAHTALQNAVKIPHGVLDNVINLPNAISNNAIHILSNNITKEQSHSVKITTPSSSSGSKSGSGGR